MTNEKLNQWADKLLDLGKTNNLMKFRDTKSSTAELISPDVSVLFRKADNNAVFEVYDPFAADADDFDTPDKNDIPDRETYLDLYSHKLRKASQVLLYNRWQSATVPLKNIAKRAKSAVEETGVNVVWIAFGFVNWRERPDGEIMNAPLLLVPARIEHINQMSPWMIRTFGDEISINTTFDYHLQQQFGVGLPPYQDEDLNVWLAQVAQLVSKLGWTVSSECKIGVFSFLKINMYRDLKDHQTLILNNPIIRTVMNEPTDIPDSAQNADIPRTGNPLIELHNVVDADSSQIEAIDMVRSGKSFVLQGPPGTGKSQTITNMIAECLADGKKVLFVAEKQAALNVVYDKLRKAGLADFCLELHSHKANKKAFIEELCRTLRADKTVVSQIAYNKVADKEQRQKALDDYESRLHSERQPLGISLYQMFELYYGCTEGIDAETDIERIETKDDEYLRNAEDLLSRYESFTESVGADYRQNAWYGYRDEDTTYTGIGRVTGLFDRIIGSVDALSDIEQTLSDTFGIAADSYRLIKPTAQLCRMLSSGQVVTPALADVSAARDVCAACEKMKSAAEQIIVKRNQIDAIFEPTVYDLDGQKNASLLIGRFNSLLSRLFSGDYKQIITEICGCLRLPKKLSYEKAVTYMKLLADCQKRLKAFAADEQRYAKYLGKVFNGVDSDWTAIVEQMRILVGICDEGCDFGRIASVFRDRPVDSQHVMEGLSARLDPVLHNCAEDFAELERLFDPAVFCADEAAFAVLSDKLKKCRASADELPNWVSFHRTLRDLQNAELLSYIEYTADNGIAVGRIIPTYKRLFYRCHIEYVLSHDEVLAGWTRASHDRQAAAFCEADTEHFLINKAVIRENVSAKKPSVNTMVAGSPIQILFTEEKKKRRQKPIRELLSQTAGLVQMIKPCFMMSPLSVSTFLTSESVHFDTVIFDEASQIFPQDAIGAIYRGNQVVIVGDDRQMPPTNFFNVTFDSDDEDSDDDLADFESILDLCSVRMPHKRLRWHYRSRYESLITFSNKHFYDNDLITFPSAAADKEQDGAGVDYCFAGGTFDRRTRTNRIEAEMVADKIFDCFKRFPNRSVGVVAFSVSQADLIDKILSKRRTAHPEFEPFFSSERPEPFFVKNLETVQGDERDIIIFSTAYGPDADGKLLLNFGPINRLGGERRLNVAVTRAKDNVQVISSLHAEDIDLKRVNSRGASLLRAYLEFAQHTHSVEQTAQPAEACNDNIRRLEDDVYQFLTEHGYTADRQVGCSGFRIDIGVRDQETSDYILAIECDGASYHNAANTRDRDRLRQQILEGMGWTFCRVWSAAWFRNNRVEKRRLLDAVKKAAETHAAAVAERKAKEEAEADERALLAARSESLTDAAAMSLSETDNPAVMKLPAADQNETADRMAYSEFDESADYLLPKNNSNSNEPVIPVDNIASENDITKEETHSQNDDKYETAVQPDTAGIPPYIMKNLSRYKDRDFADRRKFLELIKTVLETEAPLNELWLHNRMSGIFTPVKSKLTMKYINKMFGCETDGIMRRNGFLYLIGQPIVLHGPMADGTVRDIRYISPDEIAAGMMAILDQTMQADKKGLFKTVATQLGFPRMTAAITSKCELALTLLVDRTECDGEVVRKR